MDLKNALIRYSTPLIFFTLFLLAGAAAEKTPLYSLESAAGPLTGGPVLPRYRVEDGRIREALFKEFTRFDIKGRVEYLHERDGIIYYLKSIPPASYIGYINPAGDGFLFEGPLPEKISIAGVRRFFAGQGAAFIVTDDSVLYRIGINDMSLQSKSGIADACLADGKIAAVELNGSGFFFNYNGSKIPVTMTGKVAIKNIADDRIVSITNGRDVELLDLTGMKDIYQYAPGLSYRSPDKFNLVLNVVDEYDETAQSVEGEPVFYKVFINGEEKGRTDTGFPYVNKTYREMLDPDLYHLIRLERWTLDRGRGKYNRENNINQPGPIHLYVPGNRVIRIQVKCNGGRYSLQKSILMN